jgi:hypothetical protein
MTPKDHHNIPVPYQSIPPPLTRCLIRIEPVSLKYLHPGVIPQVEGPQVVTVVRTEWAVTLTVVSHYMYVYARKETWHLITGMHACVGEKVFV